MTDSQFTTKLWKIICDHRGGIDGWELRQIVLGLLFFEAVTKATNMAAFYSLEAITYGPTPLQRIKEAFAELEGLLGENYAGVFDTIDFRGTLIGIEAEKREARLLGILQKIAALKPPPGDFLGNAYEFLVSQFDTNSGRAWGEFFTPPCLSVLTARLALQGQPAPRTVYDPTCGSGGLLLQVKKQLQDEATFYGQEVNRTTYNLARMNMYLHGITHNLKHGDTLAAPQLQEEKPFDIIVSNPPYSIKWEPTSLDDPRFAPAGILPPGHRADFAFILHAVNYLADNGKAAIVCFPGAMYREGPEEQIRQHLVESNLVEAIINVPENLFYGTMIFVSILVLSKHKDTTSTIFIDAKSFATREKKHSVMKPHHIDKVLQLYQNPAPPLARRVEQKEIIQHHHSLWPRDYLEPVETTEAIDLDVLDKKIENCTRKVNQARGNLMKSIERARAFLAGGE